jgi:hypothetical protein
MNTLTNEDKISVINQHKRNIEYSKYNLQVSLIEENAVSVPNTEAISSLNEQIADLDSKLSALDAEINSISQ